ncbi:MAG: hypothetical protein AB1640_10655 [bacterium]
MVDAPSTIGGEAPPVKRSDRVQGVRNQKEADERGRRKEQEEKKKDGREEMPKDRLIDTRV